MNKPRLLKAWKKKQKSLGFDNIIAETIKAVGESNINVTQNR